MNGKRTLLGLLLIATIAWLAFVATHFELVRTGAVSLSLFLEAAIGLPVVLWGLWYLVPRAARGFGSGKRGGSS